METIQHSQEKDTNPRQSLPVQDKLALYIIGNLAIRNCIPNATINIVAEDLYHLMETISSSIAEVLPTLDMVEIDELAGRHSIIE